MVTIAAGNLQDGFVAFCHQQGGRRQRRGVNPSGRAVGNVDRVNPACNGSRFFEQVIGTRCGRRSKFGGGDEPAFIELRLEALANSARRYRATAAICVRPHTLGHEGLDAGLRPSQNEGVNIVGSFIGINGFQVQHMPDDVIFVDDPVCAVHVARHPRNVERLAA